MSLGSQIKVGVISFKKGFASQGIIKTFAMFGEALLDEVYNWKNGYDVAGFFDPEIGQVASPNQKFANYYQPVRERPFRALFSHFQIPTRGRFVDIGSGKGKALLLAAEIGFDRIVGIELFDELNEMAQKNISQYQIRHGSTKKFDVLSIDASEYQFQVDDTCIFLNDPFSNEVMEKVVTRFLHSYEQHSRPLYFIYKNNNLRHMPSLERLKKKSIYKTFEMSGNFFEVFIFP
jgi:predicted RNA methylase